MESQWCRWQNTMWEALVVRKSSTICGQGTATTATDVTLLRCILCLQGEEFAAITPERLQIPAVTGNSIVFVKIIRDMDKKPSADVRARFCLFILYQVLSLHELCRILLDHASSMEFRALYWCCCSGVG